MGDDHDDCDDHGDEYDDGNHHCNGNGDDHCAAEHGDRYAQCCSHGGFDSRSHVHLCDLDLGTVMSNNDINHRLDALEHASITMLRDHEPVTAEYERGFAAAFAIVKNYMNDEGDPHV